MISCTGKPLQWIDYYKPLEEAGATAASLPADEPLITLSADNMNLADFIRWLSMKTDCSICIDDSLRRKTISGEFVDQPLSSVITSAARQVGADSTRVGSMYRIGILRQDDRAFLCAKCSRLEPDKLQKLVGGLCSSSGTVTCSSDGLIVVADKQENLVKIDQLLKQLSLTRSAPWCIQLYIFSCLDSWKLNLGLIPTPTVRVFGNYTKTKLGEQSNWSLSATLDSLLDSSFGSSNAELISQPLILAIDGVPTKIHVGQSLPIPLKTVSNEGTVTTTGYQYIQTGLLIDLVISQSGQQEGLLKLDLDHSSLDGYQDGAPITTNNKISTQTICLSGGTYLLALLNQTGNEGHSDIGSKLASLNIGKSSKVYTVFARVYRIQPKGDSAPCRIH